MSGAIILIPARMAANRLPGKPLADIAGEPDDRACAAAGAGCRIGEVVVATNSEVIAAAVEKAGGRAVMTRTDHVSGSDRISRRSISSTRRKVPRLRQRAGRLADARRPAISSAALAPACRSRGRHRHPWPPRSESRQERSNPNVVKVVGSPVVPGRLRALYFTRATAPAGEGPLYHHIGLYAYRRAALARFVGLPPSALERRERLEQLRALEAGMRIDVVIVDSVPLGVDTPEDLETARALLRSGAFSGESLPRS